MKMLLLLVFLAHLFGFQFAEAPAPPALLLTGALVTIQAELTREITLPDGTRTYVPGSKADMLAKLEEEVQNANADPAAVDGAFFKKLVPNDRNGEILVGWITDIEVKPHGYVIITSQKVDPANPSAKREAYISDDSNLICRAKINGPAQPSAKDLNHGIDFPGAVPWNLYHE
jgi:hypothetical protein